MDQPASRTRFYRDKRNGKINGMCAGIADYTGVDVNLVRWMMVFAFFFAAAIDSSSTSSPRAKRSAASRPGPRPISQEPARPWAGMPAAARRKPNQPRSAADLDAARRLMRPVLIGIALLVAPGLQMIAAIMVIERSLAYAISNPAIKVLWTSVSPDEKYKAQNFVDTVVYRGGDASSGAIFRAIGQAAGSAGASAPIVAVSAIPLTIVWLWTGRALAKEQHETHDQTARR